MQQSSQRGTNVQHSVEGGYKFFFVVDDVRTQLGSDIACDGDGEAALVAVSLAAQGKEVEVWRGDAVVYRVPGWQVEVGISAF